MSTKAESSHETEDLRQQISRSSDTLSLEQRSELKTLLAVLEKHLQGALRSQTEATSALFSLIDIAR